VTNASFPITKFVIEIKSKEFRHGIIHQHEAINEYYDLIHKEIADEESS
jgi:hypothetical protein